MRAIYLLRRTFDSPAAQKRGFSNCTGGKEELELRMRNALHLSETSRATTKSKKLVDSASLGRLPVVPMKCAVPVSPFSVRPLPEIFSESRDDFPWIVSRAVLRQEPDESHNRRGSQRHAFRPPSAPFVPSIQKRARDLLLFKEL